jgi:hypothetical protein
MVAMTVREACEKLNGTKDAQGNVMHDDWCGCLVLCAFAAAIEARKGSG